MKKITKPVTDVGKEVINGVGNVAKETINTGLNVGKDVRNGVGNVTKETLDTIALNGNLGDIAKMYDTANEKNKKLIVKYFLEIAINMKEGKKNCFLVLSMRLSEMELISRTQVHWGIL